jgi:hypothetical protein
VSILVAFAADKAAHDRRKEEEERIKRSEAASKGVKTKQAKKNTFEAEWEEAAPMDARAIPDFGDKPEVKPEANQPTERAFDWQASRMETNDMQRRGLSLNADGGASQAAKAIDFLAKIADILNTAKITDRALTWT